MNLRVNNFSLRPNFKGSITVVGTTRMYYGKPNNECDTKPLKQINVKDIEGIYGGCNVYPGFYERLSIVLKDKTEIEVESTSYEQLKKAIEKEKETDYTSNTKLLGNYMTAKMDTEYFMDSESLDF